MSKERPSVGADGTALPILPPDRDPRLWTRLVRVMFFTPGFVALLLIKAGEPAAFGVTIELLLLSCATAVVAGLFIATQAASGGADTQSQISLWCGELVIAFLSVVPFLCALPALFHQLANSTLLHAKAPGAADIALGASELIPFAAILPFMIYQLSGFGVLSYLVSKTTNWLFNLTMLATILAAYVANRTAHFHAEEMFPGFLVIFMSITVFFGIRKLTSMQEEFSANAPAKEPKEPKEAKEAKEAKEQAISDASPS